MTQIFFGDRLDVLVKVNKLQNVEQVKVTDKHEFNMLWQSNTIPRKNLVFVDLPSSIDPKDIKPRADRHLAFLDKDVSKPWSTWATKHKIKPEGGFIPSEKFVSLLMEGTAEIPKFTREAAEHVVSCNPGGFHVFYWVIETIKDLELKEPICFKDVFEVWPFVVHEGKTYTVDSRELVKHLGFQKGIELAAKIPEREAFGGLKYLEKACKATPDRVQLVKLMIQGIKEVKWSSKAALVLLAHLCYMEKQWQSNLSSKTLSSPVASQMLQLFDIPSLAG